MRFIKPLDEAMINWIWPPESRLPGHSGRRWSVSGGAGSAVLEFLNQQRISYSQYYVSASDDVFPSQGSREQVLEDYGLDPANDK